MIPKRSQSDIPLQSDPKNNPSLSQHDLKLISNLSQNEPNVTQHDPEMVPKMIPPKKCPRAMPMGNAHGHCPWALPMGTAHGHCPLDRKHASGSGFSPVGQGSSLGTSLGPGLFGDPRPGSAGWRDNYQSLLLTSKTPARRKGDLRPPQ